MQRARRPGPSVRTRVVEHTVDSEVAREDRLVTEEPLEIRVRAGRLEPRRAWVTMRTPGHDFELAAGWLVNEGLAAPDAVTQVAYCTDADLTPDQELNVVTVSLAAGTDLPHRHVAASAGSSACGVCGKDSVADALATRTAPPWSGRRPDAEVVRRLPEALRERQVLFARTGGVHAAGLADADGTILVVREDVGRHNAVDKVVGSRVLAGESPAAACLVLSGRVGFELVQKAAASGIGAIVAVGAPTSLAAQLAGEAGIHLWGFTSAGRSVNYT
ncbi:formate dehydrogenase accessory sulfurtransferase FdhD [Nocardioides ganghwensis]|jgi:FdhD protein|uniref:Sulfurtransferase FdhD n=1 Tax=Nocardioides ganghwensis TaxID=252230 RepID=A0A4Q2SDY2_9ACTN|nr:formate dehydrogenase accessory sulfurtransferase FdhD [Nocardioides ganghwensis]MBD3946194.1 formate dehydrogenase accessory sulfurtransferase FdhD [Nocardioides ganghwensis]RYC03535.1 sulfurtransferase FdhD [Nocardioides ganghwensis]